jgi:hypothetical protein
LGEIQKQPIPATDWSLGDRTVRAECWKEAIKFNMTLITSKILNLLIATAVLNSLWKRIPRKLNLAD